MTCYLVDMNPDQYPATAAKKIAISILELYEIPTNDWFIKLQYILQYKCLFDYVI